MSLVDNPTIAALFIREAILKSNFVEIEDVDAERIAQWLERGEAQRVACAGLINSVEIVTAYLEGNADPANPDDPDNWVLPCVRVLRSALEKLNPDGALSGKGHGACEADRRARCAGAARADLPQS